ncbi:MAG: ABC transporter permease, partial [Candidatus Bipolaricaulis sp.]|nr:ABC transporter permease [Candidatus Bipolaricaulis sp.]
MATRRGRPSRLLRVIRKPKGAIGLLLLVSLTLLAILAPYVAPRDPLQQNLRWRNQPPGSVLGDPGEVSWLGTDQLGRDMLSRILYGTRVSLLVAIFAVGVAGVIGTALGVLSGYAGGALDTVIMRVVDLQLSLPLILIAMVWIAFTTPSLLNIIMVIAFWTWTQYARVVRAHTLSVKESGFIESARAIGTPKLMILVRHVLPNVFSSVLVIASLQFGRAIILEATLSFLGVGLQPPAPALGVMIASGRQYVDTAWWLATMPGIVIML